MFLPQNVTSGKIAETIRPRREFVYCAILSEALGKIMIVCLTARNLLFQIDVMSK